MEEQHPVQEIAIEDESGRTQRSHEDRTEGAGLPDPHTRLKIAIRQALMEKSRACMYLQQVIRTMDNACEDVSADMDRIREDRDELLRQITDQKFFEDACKVVQKHTDRIFEILSETEYIQQRRGRPDLRLTTYRKIIWIRI